MFENITTKNAFVNADETKQNKHGVNVYTIDADQERYVAKTWDEDYADFIAYCFNLQQRYDISKLEEAVKLLEKVEYIRRHNYDISIGLLSNIEGLLKEIKK